jgi:hypothetical protein
VPSAAGAPDRSRCSREKNLLIHSACVSDSAEAGNYTWQSKTVHFSADWYRMWTNEFSLGHIFIVFNSKFELNNSTLNKNNFMLMCCGQNLFHVKQSGNSLWTRFKHTVK